MSQFSYEQYQSAVQRAQEAEAAEKVKIGFFKLKNNGDEALVRFNVHTLDDLQFATIHQLGAAHKWMKVSCLNPFGSFGGECPLCTAVSEGNTSIGAAKKRVFVQMLVAYRDPATQNFSAAIPVIWERPAGFSREIANLLRDYQDLTQRVFKITRNGAAGDMQTTYSIAYIPVFDNVQAVADDFTAFNNFNIAKHSFWEKSAEDMITFLTTNSFPEVASTNAPSPAKPAAPTRPTQAPAAAPIYTPPATDAPPAFVPPVAPTTAPDPAYMSQWQVPVPPVAPTVVPPVITCETTADWIAPPATTTACDTLPISETISVATKATAGEVTQAREAEPPKWHTDFASSMPNAGTMPTFESAQFANVNTVASGATPPTVTGVTPPKFSF